MPDWTVTELKVSLVGEAGHFLFEMFPYKFFYNFKNNDYCHHIEETLNDLIL